MAKPLRSDDPNPPSVQFRDFGVLNDGSRSKGAAVTSIVLNVSIAALIVILGFVVKSNPVIMKKVTEITLPPEPPPQPKPIPKPPPPPPVKLQPPPPVPPKIKPIPVPDPPPDVKPLPTPPTPKPVPLPPAPPKKVDPPPAPTKVNLGVAKAASIPNHDANPSAVRLGNPTNPLKPLTGPAVSPVSLGVAGMPGMRASNTGSGPHATSVNMGSGSPNGNNLNGHDNASRVVAGVNFGVKGGTGPLTSRTATAVTPSFGAPPPPARTPPPAATLSAATPPKVTYKPQPVYSEEAKAMHLEGKAVVSVVFHANGAMEVVGLVRGLGHGLDESALTAARGVKFQPALDAGGRPVDFPTQIIITFTPNS
jgi:TonB family protein